MDDLPFIQFALLIVAPDFEDTMFNIIQDIVMINLMRVTLAIERYRADNGDLPERLQALVPTYLDEIPTDIVRDMISQYEILEIGYTLSPGVRDEIKNPGPDAHQHWYLETDAYWYLEVYR